MAVLFSNISSRNRRKICRFLEATTLRVSKNDELLSSVKSKNAICYVSVGSLEITKMDANGNLTIIEKLQQDSLFETKPYFYSNSEYEIVAKEDSTIIIFDYNLIIDDRNNHVPLYNEFIKNLLQISFDKLNEKNEQIEILSQKSIRNKLLAYFRILSQKTGTRIIYLPMNYSDLANYLAIDRCAMTRELKYLEEEGFIKRSGKRISLTY